MFRWLTHHFVAKTVCFIAACLLWYYITSEQLVQRTLAVPVTAQLAPDFTVVKISPRQLAVTVSGTEKDLANLTEQDLQIKLDLTSYTQPTSLQYSVLDRHVSAPASVDVDGVEPGQVQIVVDRIITKYLTVQVNFSGAPQDGYQIHAFTVNPSTAAFQGPASVLESMTSVNTLPIDLTGRNRSFVETVPLLPIFSDQKAGLSRLVDVYVTIGEKTQTRTFEQIPIQILSPPGIRKKVTLSPAVSSVTLEGNAAVISALDPQKISLFVTMEKFEDGVYRLPVGCRAPENTRAAKITPAEAEASVD